MRLRTKHRIKLVSDTILFLSLGLASLTGLLKMPLLADRMPRDLYQRYQELPWEFLNLLHDWSGVVALVCVLVHLSLVGKRYLWLLKNGWNSGR